MKQRCYNVVPECYADTVLVEMLGFVRPNHAPSSNISQVLNTIKKSRPNMKVVGIIDGDRGRSEKLLKKQLEGFTLLEDKEGIKKYISGKHTILILHPAFEAWVFENASLRAVDILPSKYGFFDLKDFKVACKDEDANENRRLKQFLNALKQKQAPGFVQLKTWICEAADISEEDL